MPGQKKPAAQLVQGGASPITLLYVPAEQKRQELGKLKNVPGGQNEEQVDEPAVLAVFGAQGKHAYEVLAPSASLKVPAGHAVQVVLCGALQKPAVQQTPAPSVLPVPAGQLEQEAEPAALNVRRAHGEQEAGACGKVPAGHDAAVKAQEGAPAVL